MIVTRTTMDEYTADVNAVSDEAARVAMYAYDAMRIAYPNASVADIRDGITSIVESVLASHGDAAGELAAERYDAMAAASGADVPEAIIAEEDDAMANAIERRARYIVGCLVPDREDI